MHNNPEGAVRELSEYFGRLNVGPDLIWQIRVAGPVVLVLFARELTQEERQRLLLPDMADHTIVKYYQRESYSE